MCVDFTNLNKACPEDSYPLPRIDLLVNSTTSHQLYNFMDAFFGYNQIKLDEVDQEDLICHEPKIFCYKVMPFGLKNTGAAYQRLVNKMFAPQIGRNVEVYIDDMLVKSAREISHLAIRQLKFLVVGINYFTKWAEAKPLDTITEKNV